MRKKRGEINGGESFLEGFSFQRRFINFSEFKDKNMKMSFTLSFHSQFPLECPKDNKFLFKGQK
jgi:hypothetical protein